MALAKRSMNVGNFNCSYSRGAGQRVYSTSPIQFALPASTGGYSRVPQQPLTQDGQRASYFSDNRQSLDRVCFNCGELGHIRR